MGKEKTVRPSVLYHASENRNIKILQPRNKTKRSEEEGPVVFATADKTDATKFIVSCDDSWTMLGAFGNVDFYICADRKRFEISDKGGAIYYLSSETFYIDHRYGDYEWTSKTPVVPVFKEEYASGLEAMLDAGVQVFFTDKNAFQRILESKDHGNSIIRKLESENAKRGINIRGIPDIHQKQE